MVSVVDITREMNVMSWAIVTQANSEDNQDCVIGSNISQSLQPRRERT